MVAEKEIFAAVPNPNCILCGKSVFWDRDIKPVRGNYRYCATCSGVAYRAGIRKGHEKSWPKEKEQRKQISPQVEKITNWRDLPGLHKLSPEEVEVYRAKNRAKLGSLFSALSPGMLRNGEDWQPGERLDSND